GALGPGQTAAMPVAVPVVRGRARDPVGGEAFGYGVDARPGQELREVTTTTAAARSSRARTRSLLPSAALAGFGCGRASMSRYPDGGRPPRERPSIWA